MGKSKMINLSNGRFLLLCTICFLLCCSCMPYSPVTKQDTSIETEESYGGDENCFLEENTGSMNTSLMSNINLYAIHHPIEEAYLAEANQNTGETASLVSLYNKYAELWYDELVKYQMLIEKELSESGDVLTSFQTMMEQWSSDLDTEVDTFLAIETYLHGNATIVGPNVSKYTMQQYRMQVLKLISIYEEIMLDRGWRWESQTW